MVVEAVAERLEITFRRPLFRRYEIARGSGRSVSGVQSSITLVKPLTYMNRSGDILASALRRSGAQIDELVVICDQLDLPPGTVRIKRGGSTAGHRGLESISRALAGERFVRLYVGIGKPCSRDRVVDHVLGRADGAEAQRLRDGLRLAADAVLRLAETTVEEAMNEFNQRGTHAS